MFFLVREMYARVTKRGARAPTILRARPYAEPGSDTTFLAHICKTLPSSIFLARDVRCTVDGHSPQHPTIPRSTGTMSSTLHSQYHTSLTSSTTPLDHNSVHTSGSLLVSSPFSLSCYYSESTRMSYATHEWHDVAETYMRAGNFYCIWDVWCTADGCFLQHSPPARDRRTQRPLFCIHTNGTLFSSTCPRLDSALLPQNDLCSTTTENTDRLQGKASLRDRPKFEGSAFFVTTMMQIAWYHRLKTSQAECAAEGK